MRGLLTQDEARQGYAAIHAQSPKLHASIPLVTPALELAMRHRRAVYDCLYVALAERERCQLVTADQALLNQHSKDHPLLLSLAGCPV